MLLIKISSYLPKFFYQHKLIIKWQLKTTTSLESLPVVILYVSTVSSNEEVCWSPKLFDKSEKTLILPIMLLI